LSILAVFVAPTPVTSENGVIDPADADDMVSVVELTPPVPPVAVVDEVAKFSVVLFTAVLMVCAVDMT
jgi:hypothetical protein